MHNPYSTARLSPLEVFETLCNGPWDSPTDAKGVRGVNYESPMIWLYDQRKLSEYAEERSRQRGHETEDVREAKAALRRTAYLN